MIPVTFSALHIHFRLVLAIACMAILRFVTLVRDSCRGLPDGAVTGPLQETQVV
jgi:hypothetical protein